MGADPPSELSVMFHNDPSLDELGRSRHALLTRKGSFHETWVVNRFED